MHEMAFNIASADPHPRPLPSTGEGVSGCTLGNTEHSALFRMPPRSTQLPADLTDHWPDDPANEDLARLAGDLVSTRRELPTISLDRIQLRMRQEVIRTGRRRRWRTIAALFVLVIAGYMGVRAFLTARTSSNTTTHASRGGDSTPVQDRFQVTLPAATPKAPNRPLIDLSRHSALFGGPTSQPSKP